MLQRTIWLSVFISLYIGPIAYSQSEVAESFFSAHMYLPNPVWVLDKSQKMNVSPHLKPLAEMKIHFEEGRFDKCIAKFYKLEKSQLSLLAWLHLQKLICVHEQFKKDNKQSQLLEQSLNFLKQEKTLFQNPAAGAKLFDAFKAGYLSLLDFDLKSYNKRAWKSIEVLDGYFNQLNLQEQSFVLEAAGEMSFFQKKYTQSGDFYFRSYQLEKKPSVLAKLQALTQFGFTFKGEPEVVASIPEVMIALSDKEKNLRKQYAESQAKQNFIDAMEAGVDLLNEFPGSDSNIELSESLRKILVKILTNKSDQNEDLQNKIIKRALKAPSYHLFKWSQSLHLQGEYASALRLAKQAYEELPEAKEMPELLQIWGKSAYFLEDMSEAEEAFTKLTLKAAGSKAASEAELFLGWMALAAGKNEKASQHFTRVFLLEPTTGRGVTAQYWLYQSLKQQNPTQAQIIGNKFIAQNPFTYYGLKIRAELNANQLNLSTVRSGEIKEKIFLLKPEALAWKNFLLLLEAGWLKEAEQELKLLPLNSSPQQRLIAARLWSSLGRYDQAVTLCNQVWTEYPELSDFSFLKYLFPNSFEIYIAKESARRNLNRILVKSLIRQESLYQKRAVSSAGAKGLMQLMSPTAKEMAQTVGLKDFDVREQIFDPRINILLGTQYLSWLHKKFENQVPFILAAYNVGIGNFQRWMKIRKISAANLNSTRTEILSDLWLDELPWGETSFYVKAILRNMILYQALEKGQIDLSKPIWLQSMEQGG